MNNQSTLKRQLKTRHLWAIAVGMVISGQYFGWNYGLVSSGFYGMFIATFIVTLFYLSFMFCYAELATCIPNAGGPSAYAKKSMGRFAGFIAGISCLIEFVFAPPAIAVAIGYYIHFLCPIISAHFAAITSFLFCLMVNLINSKDVARFELIVTLLALTGLIIYYCSSTILLIHNNTHPILPAQTHTIRNIDSAIPYAIWLYLAIEGIAMSAEEAYQPQKTISKGIISAIITLSICSFLTLFFTATLNKNFSLLADYPLSHTLSITLGKHSLITQSVDFLGLCGLIASLNGIMIGYSRQTYALAREGYLPKFLTKLSKHGTPTLSLIFPGMIGFIACSSATLSNNLIILSAFGAITMYCISLLSLFLLRKKQPLINRPFKVWFPIIPIIALTLGIICWYCVLRYSIIPHHLLYTIILIYIVSICYFFLNKYQSLSKATQLE